MSPRSPTALQATATGNASFTLFPELPKELRLLIWQKALPGPRIVLLQRHNLKFYDSSENTRVWSDKATSDVDSQGNPDFFDALWDETTDSYTAQDWEAAIQMPWIPPVYGFHTQNLPPTILLACRESQEVVERYYTRTFGDKFAFPTTWFDFEIDTLYLGWNWNNLSSMPFGPQELGSAAAKVKHLAIYNTAEDLHLRAEGPEERICRILRYFHSLETLTLVNRRHKNDEKTDDLVFMEPLDLLVWKPVREDNTADIDVSVFDRWIEDWEAEERKHTKSKDWGSLEYFREKWMEDRSLPWRIPKIRRKIILTTEMRDRLEALAGGRGHVWKLSAMSEAWLHETKRDPVHGFASVDFTPEQQLEYLRAIEEFDEVSATSIDAE